MVERTTGNYRAGRAVFAEAAGIHGIHGRPMDDIRDKYGRLHHLV